MSSTGSPGRAVPPARVAGLLALAATIALTAVASAVGSGLISPAAAATLYGTSFEEGLTAGWSAEAATQVTVSTSAAHTGTHSLQVSGITAFGQGTLVTIPSTGLRTGTWYDLRAVVRLAGTAAAAPLTFTAVSGQRRSGFSVPVYTNWQLDTGEAWSDQLTQLVPFSPPEAHFQWDGTSTNVVFRLAAVAGCPATAPRPPAAFYVDDVNLDASSQQSQITVIAGRCDPPTVTSTSTTTSATTTSVPTTTTSATATTTTTPAGQVVATDFEDGTVQGWKPLGGTTLAVVVDPVTGTRRLRVSGISAVGQGAALEVDPAALTDGTGYTARGYGRLPAGQPPALFQLRAVSAVADRPFTEALFGDSTGSGYLETDLTWASSAPSLQLQVLAVAACPGQALPTAFEVDNLVLRTGSFSGRPVYQCPTTPTTTTTTTTTSTTGGSTCTAAYQVDSQWPGGFQATVTVRAGASALTGWNVDWTVPAGETLGAAWGATLHRNGSSVTATNLSYNGRLAAGTSTTFGLLGSSTGTPAVPLLTCSTA